MAGSLITMAKRRVSFTIDEKEVLEKAFDEGMNSAGRDLLPQIENLAQKIKKDPKDIKV